MEPRTFRQASCAGIAGGVIAVVGAVLVGIAAYHLATGVPLMQASSRVHGGEHIASVSELSFGIVGGVPLFILGATLVLSAVNCAITIDQKGITATNLFKRRYFQAAWSEVSAVRRIDKRAGSGYEVIANGKTLRIETSTDHMKELVAEIQKQSSAGA